MVGTENTIPVKYETSLPTTRSSEDRRLSRRDANSQLAFLSFVMALLSAVVNIVSNVNNNNNNNNNNDNNNNNNQNNRNQNMGTVQSMYVFSNFLQKYSWLMVVVCVVMRIQHCKYTIGELDGVLAVGYFLSRNLATVFVNALSLVGPTC